MKKIIDFKIVEGFFCEEGDTIFKKINELLPEYQPFGNFVETVPRYVDPNDTNYWEPPVYAQAMVKYDGQPKQRKTVKFSDVGIMVDFFDKDKRFIKIDESFYLGKYVNSVGYEGGSLNLCESEFVEVEI